MDGAQTLSNFDTTNWSLVLAAPDDPALLARLLRTYWGPIYAFMRRSGKSREDAADLTQEFIAQAVLERDLIEKADPQRGRFRTLLKAAVRNFIIDQHRRSLAKGRSADTLLLSDAALDGAEPDENDDPHHAFDRQWGTTVLSRALAIVEDDCAACGQARHWEAFRSVVIEPALSMASPPLLADVARQMGLENPEQAASLVQTVRRKFRRVLALVVAQTLQDPSEAADEIENIRQYLVL
ncbi:hypothetical protein PHYC_03240 [Phycisphaerales bacterium]|nr:hypothetical protein PHYC_03240 [Phycisphaerales bacterium]